MVPRLDRHASYDQEVPVPPEIAAQLLAVSERLAADRQERDRLVRAAHDAGASLREIEKATGKRITHVGVKRIIERPAK